MIIITSIFPTTDLGGPDLGGFISFNSLISFQVFRIWGVLGFPTEFRHCEGNA